MKKQTRVRQKSTVASEYLRKDLYGGWVLENAVLLRSGPRMIYRTGSSEKQPMRNPTMSLWRYGNLSKPNGTWGHKEQLQSPKRLEIPGIYVRKRKDV